MLTEIPFTQFLRPNGRRTRVTVERPADILRKAEQIIEAGGVFEIEELTNRMVSMAVEHHRYDEGPVVMEMCQNGPAVPGAVDRLVEKAWVRLHCGVEGHAGEAGTSATGEPTDERIP